MIYLDNAATTLIKPRCVIDAVKKCVTQYAANPGRSGHKLSQMASEAVYECRNSIKELLNAEKEENVVFSLNATQALNIAIKGDVKENSHVLISDLEHNATLRPILALKKTKNITFTIFESGKNLEQSIEKAIKPETTHIVTTLVSNVSGREIPFEAVSRIAKMKNLRLIVDASQKIGHSNINLKSTPCDCLCAPGHKGLLGIQGVGFAVFKDSLRGKTILEGGSGTESKAEEMPILLPEGYEAGTLPTPAIVGLNAAIKYIRKIGIEEIDKRISDLSKAMRERLLSIKGLEMLEKDTKGVVSFNLQGFRSESLSYYLDKQGICTRAGLHCAPLAHKLYGTDTYGSVRVSLSYFNRMSEIDRLYKVLKELV
jgi:cysteine desulfurase family protein